MTHVNENKKKLPILKISKHKIQYGYIDDEDKDKTPEYPLKEGNAFFPSEDVLKSQIVKRKVGRPRKKTGAESGTSLGHESGAMGQAARQSCASTRSYAARQGYNLRSLAGLESHLGFMLDPSPRIFEQMTPNTQHHETEGTTQTRHAAELINDTEGVQTTRTQDQEHTIALAQNIHQSQETATKIADVRNSCFVTLKIISDGESCHIQEDVGVPKDTNTSKDMSLSHGSQAGHITSGTHKRKSFTENINMENDPDKSKNRRISVHCVNEMSANDTCYSQDLSVGSVQDNFDNYSHDYHPDNNHNELSKNSHDATIDNILGKTVNDRLANTGDKRQCLTEDESQGQDNTNGYNNRYLVDNCRNRDFIIADAGILESISDPVKQKAFQHNHHFVQMEDTINQNKPSEKIQCQDKTLQGEGTPYPSWVQMPKFTESSKSMNTSKSCDLITHCIMSLSTCISKPSPQSTSQVTNNPNWPHGSELGTSRTWSTQASPSNHHFPEQCQLLASQPEDQSIQAMNLSVSSHEHQTNLAPEASKTKSPSFKALTDSPTLHSHKTRPILEETKTQGRALVISEMQPDVCINLIRQSSSVPTLSHSCTFSAERADIPPTPVAQLQNPSGESINRPTPSVEARLAEVSSTSTRGSLVVTDKISGLPSSSVAEPLPTEQHQPVLITADSNNSKTSTATAAEVHVSVNIQVDQHSPAITATTDTSIDNTLRFSGRSNTATFASKLLSSKVKDYYKTSPQDNHYYNLKKAKIRRQLCRRVSDQPELNWQPRPVRRVTLELNNRQFRQEEIIDLTQDSDCEVVSDDNLDSHDLIRENCEYIQIQVFDNDVSINQRKDLEATVLTSLPEFMPDFTSIDHSHGTNSTGAHSGSQSLAQDLVTVSASREVPDQQFVSTERPSQEQVNNRAMSVESEVRPTLLEPEVRDIPIESDVRAMSKSEVRGIFIESEVRAMSMESEINRNSHNTKGQSTKRLDWNLYQPIKTRDISTQHAAVTLLQLSANPLYNSCSYVIPQEISGTFQEKVYQIHPTLENSETHLERLDQQDPDYRNSEAYQSGHHMRRSEEFQRTGSKTGRRVGRPPKDSYIKPNIPSSTSDIVLQGLPPSQTSHPRVKVVSQAHTNEGPSAESYLLNQQLIYSPFVSYQGTSQIPSTYPNNSRVSQTEPVYHTNPVIHTPSSAYNAMSEIAQSRSTYTTLPVSSYSHNYHMGWARASYSLDTDPYSNQSSMAAPSQTREAGSRQSSVSCEMPHVDLGQTNSASKWVPRGRTPDSRAGLDWTHPPLATDNLWAGTNRAPHDYLPPAIVHLKQSCGPRIVTTSTGTIPAAAIDRTAGQRVDGHLHGGQTSRHQVDGHLHEGQTAINQVDGHLHGGQTSWSDDQRSNFSSPHYSTSVPGLSQTLTRVYQPPMIIPSMTSSQSRFTPSVSLSGQELTSQFNGRYPRHSGPKQRADADRQLEYDNNRGLGSEDWGVQTSRALQPQLDVSGHQNSSTPLWSTPCDPDSTSRAKPTKSRTNANRKPRVPKEKNKKKAQSGNGNMDVSLMRGNEARDPQIDAQDTKAAAAMLRSFRNQLN